MILKGGFGELPLANVVSVIYTITFCFFPYDKIGGTVSIHGLERDFF